MTLWRFPKRTGLVSDSMYPGNLPSYTMSAIRRAALSFILVASLLGAETVPKELLHGITSDDFSEREASQAKLLEWSERNPKVAASALLKLSKTDEDPEVRKRCDVILRALGEADYLSEGQGYIGILMQEEMLDAGGENDAPMGIRVLDVMPGSPAEKADLRVGDLIVTLDGKGWKGIGAVTKFGEVIAAKKPLVAVKLSVRRGGADLKDITVKLGKRPVADLRAAGGDLREFEERAKERHFKKWLLEQGAK